MQKRSVKLGIMSALVGLSSFILLGSTSYATTTTPTTNPNGAFNVIISPTAKDLTVKPGGNVSETFQLKNRGIATEHIKISVMKFGSDNKTGLPQLITPGPHDTFINWASFSSTQFDAEPGVWTPVTMTISPPTTAAFGYYYAVVFSRSQSQTPNGSHASNLLGSVASLVLLDVQAPGEVRQSEISQFSTDHHINEFLPTTFSVKMKNSGNVHVAPRGNIFITKDGHNVAMLEVNLAEGNILPHTSRIFTAQWTDGTPSYTKKMVNGKYVVDSNDKQLTYLNWNNFSLNKLRFGKYHAMLVMVYSDGKLDVPLKADLSFWVIPWRILAFLLILLVIVIAGVWTLIFRPLRRRLSAKQRGNVKLR